MRAALWIFLLLAPASVVALAVGGDPPEEFVSRSKADPGRLYALEVGATWCGPCHDLADELAAYSQSSGTAVSRAVWDKVEVDVYGEKRFEDFLKGAGARVDRGFPSVLVFRGGAALGYTSVGANLARITAFLEDAAVYRRPDKPEPPPSLLCPQRRDWAQSTLGISGLLSANDRSTDDFGLANIVSFASPGKPATLRVFAATAAAPGGGGVPSPSDAGILFAPEALGPWRERVERVERSTYALAGLAAGPAKTVRLVLTGHSSAKGLAVGYDPDPMFAHFGSERFLTEAALTEDVRAARAGGKEVRGIVLTCYGGQFGESFMPGAGLAPSCAVFATLPEKLAEGCYENGVGTRRRDYLAEAASLKRCPEPGDGRRRHYEAVVKGTGRDVPMLSSEYFLLYGPAAAYLGRGERAPAPPRGIVRKKLGSGVEVFLDLVGGGVIKATRDGQSLPAPRVGVVDCRRSYGGYNSLDGKSESLFHLRGRRVGAKAVEREDCTALLRLDWDPEEGDAPPGDVVALSAQDGDAYDPTVVWSGEVSQALGSKPEVDIRGLKPEARVLLKTVVPAFASDLAGQGLVDLILARAQVLRADDPVLAEALESQAAAVLRERREFQARISSKSSFLVPPPGLDKVPDWKDALLEAATGKAVVKAPPANPRREDDVYFTSSYLIQAMLFNIAPAEYDADSVPMARLAHLAAATEAELALRAEAKTSAKAKLLLKQFDSMVACEAGLY
ncbi:MAG: thioredoxin family protein [Elusimicrobia bacterium]|nr:thioredoxin family protein [Elusimicrobiota bacterium]